MSNDLSELPLPSELLLFIQRMMSLLLQGQNIIEMMVILIMLKARKFDKVMDE